MTAFVRILVSRLVTWGWDWLPGVNLKSISHRCHPMLMAFVWELTNETIDLPLGCLQGGLPDENLLVAVLREVDDGGRGVRLVCG